MALAERNDNELPKVISSKKIVDDALKNRGMPTTEEEEQLNNDEAAALDQGLAVDVFDFCEDRRLKTDEVIAYDISRNGSYVAKKYHPYSWQDLQKEFGAGNYKVIAKSENTRKYIKQQTRFVQEDPTAKPVVPSTQPQDIEAAIRRAIPQTPPTPAKDPLEEMVRVATALKAIMPPPAQESGSSELLKTVLQLQQESQKQTQTLILEMNKSNREMLDRLDANRREDQRRLEDQLTKVQNSPKEKGLGAMELLEMMQSAEARGRENMEMIMDMAERQARKLSRDDDDEEGDDKEPKGMLERIIANTAPTVIKALAERGLSAPTPQAMGMPVATQPAPVKAPPTPQVVQPQQRTIPVPPRAPTPPPGARPVPPQVNSIRRPVPGAPVVVPQAKVIPTQKIGGVYAPTKPEVVEQILPLIGTGLLAAEPHKYDREMVKKTQDEAAIATAKILREKYDQPVSYLLQLIPHNDMLAEAKNFPVPLPKEAFDWLEGYYESLTNLRVPA